MPALCALTPAGSPPAAPQPARLNQPCSGPNRPLSYLPPQPRQGAKAWALSLGPALHNHSGWQDYHFPKHMAWELSPPSSAGGLQGLPAQGDLACTPPLLPGFFNLPQCRHGQSSGSPAVPSTALGAGNSSSSFASGRLRLRCYSFQPDAWLELQ